MSKIMGLNKNLYPGSSAYLQVILRVLATTTNKDWVTNSTLNLVLKKYPIKDQLRAYIGCF